MNITKITGYLSTKFQRGSGPYSGAQLSIPFNSAKEGEDAKWEYLNVSVRSNEDLSEFNSKRVILTGYLDVDYFTPKGAENELTKLVLVITADPVEVAKGEKGTNVVKLATRVSLSEKAKSEGWNPQVSVRGRKSESEDFRYVNLSTGGRKDVLSALNDADLIEATGFLTGYVKDKNGKKEILPTFVMMDVKQREATSEDDAPPPPTEESAPAETTPTQTPAAEEEDEDNIPF